MRGKQQKLNLGRANEVSSEFGGILLTSNPKTKRPITTRQTMHIVMRSTLAKGERALTRKARELEEILNKQAKRAGVKLYRRAIAGNHIHMIILPRSRDAYKQFIRSISGIIGRKILGVERGRTAGSKALREEKSETLRAWDARPFSRIIAWGKDFVNTCAYVFQNKLEATGFIPYQERGGRWIRILDTGELV